MKTLIAIPCMAMIHTRFVKNLISMRLPPETKVMMTESSLIYDARNTMALTALEGGYDYVMWLDSDMTFGPDILYQLLEDAKQYDYVTGLIFSRRLPTNPLILSKCNWQMTDDGAIHETELMKDYPKDSLFEIAGSGSAACIVKTELYDKVTERFRQAPYQPLQQFGEDYSFCWKLSQIGVKMACDSRIKVGHIGQIEVNEEIYLNQNVG